MAKSFWSYRSEFYDCRYFAVTRPIEYSKHNRNNKRVWLTIVLVWVVSAAIGSPIVLGLNNTPNRQPDLCLFYHTDFIIYSSLSSFYIPCLTMVFLYYRIFSVSIRKIRNFSCIIWRIIYCKMHFSRHYFMTTPYNFQTLINKILEKLSESKYVYYMLTLPETLI